MAVREEEVEWVRVVGVRVRVVKVRVREGVLAAACAAGSWASCPHPRRACVAGAAPRGRTAEAARPSSWGLKGLKGL